ncbi:UNVERIFIED_CONTAM: hypothetical protein Sradi_6505200 [Sesamum radiatum]|uniref:Uncharacterized protein n=1 Tax=Sesamum radiatum TaxID=300843 RepID=A0AAW2JVD0_SESRA
MLLKGSVGRTGYPAEDVPVDQLYPLGSHTYKAPSDGKWGEPMNWTIFCSSYVMSGAAIQMR